MIEAISKDIKMGGGLGIGILKGEDVSETNDYLSIPVSTEMGIARNSNLTYNRDVALAISGQYSTLSEIAYAFQLSKTVIGYETWDIKPIIKAESPNDVMSKLKREF